MNAAVRGAVYANRIVVKGGPGSGWYAPPTGTHSGAEHVKVGSGKATAAPVKKKVTGVKAAIVDTIDELDSYLNASSYFIREDGKLVDCLVVAVDAQGSVWPPIGHRYVLDNYPELLGLTWEQLQDVPGKDRFDKLIDGNGIVRMAYDSDIVAIDGIPLTRQGVTTIQNHILVDKKIPLNREAEYIWEAANTGETVRFSYADLMAAKYPRDLKDLGLYVLQKSVFPFMRIVVKGSSSSGWYAPPTGTHSGAEHAKVGSGKTIVKITPIERTGLSSPISDVEGMSPDQKGKNEAYIVTHEDGTRGIFKPSEGIRGPGFAEAEVIAYEMSESIGWGLVPETVMTEIEGRRGSEQRWIEDAKTGRDTSVAGRIQEYKDAAGSMDMMRTHALDSVVGSFDRHDGNWLLDGKGKLWAIDNEVSNLNYRHQARTGRSKWINPASERFIKASREYAKASGRSVDEITRMRTQAFQEIAAWSKTPAYDACIKRSRDTFKSPGARDVYTKNMTDVMAAVNDYYAAPATKDVTVILKGSSSSGWYAPPTGTHSGERHREIGSGKATAIGKKVVKITPVKKTGISSPVSDTSPTHGKHRGINESYIVTHEDGTRGIFKPGADMEVGTAEAEVIAYEFSDSLGWGLVPETVMTEIDGKRGSEQRWIEDANAAKATFGPPHKQARGSMDAMRMEAMDRAFQNFDRHTGNYLIGSDGKLWAIDNGASSFGSGWFNQKIPDPASTGFEAVSRAFGVASGKSTAEISALRVQAYKEIAAWTKTEAYGTFLGRIQGLAATPKTAGIYERDLASNAAALRKYYGD